MMAFTIVIMTVQIFIPVINFHNLEIVPDILIIFLTYIGFFHERFYVIIMGFLLGITQDFITQVELIGAMAFTKSIIAFGLGVLFLYKSIWPRSVRILYIFFLYNLHFIIYYFIRFNGVPTSFFVYIQVVTIHSLLSISILFIIDKSFIRYGITAK